MKKRLGWRELHPVTRALIVIAAVDFFVTAALAIALGGYASDGYARAGHYFVANHGVTKEVGRAAWTVSLVLDYSLYALVPGAALAFAIDAFRRREEPERTSILGRDDAPPRRRR